MPIHDRILKKHGKKLVILMAGNQTLNGVIQRLQEGGYPENDTYLVVSLSNQQYKVAPLLGIRNIVTKMGPDTLIQPLADLPIPAASRVEHKNTSETAKSVENWLTNHPGATIVVINDQGFVGLMAMTNMAGVFDSLILGALEGEDVDIGQDFRADVTKKVAVPTCPHCNHRNFFNYDLEQNQFVCPNCRKVID